MRKRALAVKLGRNSASATLNVDLHCVLPTNMPLNGITKESGECLSISSTSLGSGVRQV